MGPASAERTALAAEAVVTDVADDTVVVIAARSLHLGRSRDGAGYRSGKLRDGQVVPVEERLAFDPVPVITGFRLAGLPEPDAHGIARPVTDCPDVAVQPGLQARRDVDIRLTELVVLDFVSGCLLGHSHHLLEVDVRTTGGGLTIYYTTYEYICKLLPDINNPRRCGGYWLR